MFGRKLLAALVLSVFLAPPAQAAPPQPVNSGWTCDVRISAWNGYFTATGTLGWSGPPPTPGWTVTFVLPSNLTVQQVWSGTYTQSGANGRITSPSWGGFVPLNFGFSGRYTGAFTPPSDIRVDSVPCTVTVA
ncbi:MAG TPA: cellulose binding domain-containing protein [Candidatus Limnocylindrales bacterium]